MARTIRWRLHTAAPPEDIFALWSSDAGRERFWAERSRSDESGFRLTFIDGSEQACRLLCSEPPRLFAFRYFGSTVAVTLDGDGGGGTDLTLVDAGVAEADFDEVHAGWLNVLFPLKGAADFGIDLRNHDPARGWRQGYVDQ